MTRTAIVTGSDSGIGRATAVALAQAGLDVGITWHRDEQGARETAEEVRGVGRRAEVRQLDLTRLPEAADIIDELAGALGGQLWLLVNNSGTGAGGSVLELSYDDWRGTLSVDLDGAFLCLQRAARIMVRQGEDGRPGGRIVNVTSAADVLVVADLGAYIAAKGAIVALTKVLALEWGEHGVTVNAVAPTFIRTPGTAERLDRPEFLRDVLARIPIGRVGTTTEVAAAVIFLASPGAGLVNGTTILVDGGWTAQ